jgi:hypothetical protein
VRLSRLLAVLATLALAVVAANPAEGGNAVATSCGVQSFEYAGLQANNKAHGISATLSTTDAPSVINGHVGGWIGLGGTQAGPGGVAEWIQIGLAAFPSDSTSDMYYEVTVAGQQPKYTDLGSEIGAGISHRFAVLEMAGKKAWWRVWVDGKAVSPPIYLPGSDDTWYPQAVAENWNGGTGACNSYSYKFSNVSLAQTNGGVWRPLKLDSLFQDPGYHIVPLSNTPRDFLAASVA